MDAAYPSQRGRSGRDAGHYQTGTQMTPEDLRHWQAEMGYTYDTASAALGTSRRAYASWLSGEARIPGMVDLACAALVERLAPYSERGTTGPL